MSSVLSNIDAQWRPQALRFVANGVAAAAVHFLVLSFNMEVLRVPSAGLANLFAAMAGITISFLGNRYFVFRAKNDIIGQLAKFGVLYTCIAVLHASVLWVWTDIGGYDYRLVFLLATTMQMILSFVGNKILVFK